MTRSAAEKKKEKKHGMSELGVNKVWQCIHGKSNIKVGARRVADNRVPMRKTTCAVSTQM